MVSHLKQTHKKTAIEENHFTFPQRKIPICIYGKEEKNDKYSCR